MTYKYHTLAVLKNNKGGCVDIFWCYMTIAMYKFIHGNYCNCIEKCIGISLKDCAKVYSYAYIYHCTYVKTKFLHGNLYIQSEYLFF